MIEVKVFAKPKSSTGTSGSSSSTTYVNTTVSDAEHASSADKATRAENADRATYADRSGTAQNAAYASKAGNLAADAEILEDYLYKRETEDMQTVQGAVTFDSAITASSSLTVSGDTSLQDVEAKGAVVESLSSSDYESELYQGFGIEKSSNGKYRMEINDLVVWGKASFSQLEVRKVSYAGGTTIYSNAGSTLKRVCAVQNASGKVIAYKCYAVADDGTTKTMNWWTVGMMALCQTFNVQEGTTEDAANRYYWRLVVGKGQEMLEDGKLYDYVLLSNVAQFTGSDENVPVYTTKSWAVDEEGTILVFGTVSIAINKKSLGSFADGCDTDVDDGGTKIADRLFYGYQPTSDGSEPDAPQAEDVIVQVGDQVAWNTKGNLIMLTTYDFDGNGRVPAIAMYHSMGALYTDESGNVSPFTWNTLTHLMSPKKTLMNSDCFSFFSGSVNNLISPITVTYDIIPSSSCISVAANGDFTPDDITLTVMKHTGDRVEEDDETDITLEMVSSLDGRTYTAEYAGSVVATMDVYGYDFTLSELIELKAYIQKGTNILSSLNIPIVKDGATGNTPAVSGTKTQYAITTSPTDKPTAWQDVNPYTDADKGKFLWTKTTITWNTGTSSESTTCTYIGKDGDNGTSVAIKGSLDSTDKLPTSGQTNGDGYLIDGYLWVYTGSTTSTAVHGFENVGRIKGDPGTSAIQYYYHVAWKNTDSDFTTSNPGGASYDYIGTLIDTTAADSQTPSDYSWAYVRGEQGDEGQSAVDIVVSGSPLVFDTDESGKVTSSALSGQSATIVVYRKGSNVTVNCTFSCSTTSNCTASISKGSSAATVKIKSISDVTTSGYTMSAQAGYVNVAVKYGGTNYYAQIPFQVNMVKMMGSFKSDNKSLESKFTEISNTVDAIPLKNQVELLEYTAEIAQTARDISLKVSEKQIGRRNMLIGSSAAKYGEGWTWMNGGGSYDGTVCEAIDTENSVDGTNSLHCYSAFKGTDSYINAGFHWQGTGSPQGNIKVEKGKSYTISFYAKATDLEKVCFVLETIYEGSATDYSRPAGYAGPTGFSEVFSVSNNDTWQLITKTISVPSDAAYEYLEVCLFVRAKADTTGLQEGWLCRPMMEEGDTYNGWTMSADDLDSYSVENKLQATGIDIENKKVTITADTFKVKNNDGDETMLLDQSGTLNTELVKAKTLETTSVDGARVLVQEGLMQFFNPNGACNIQFGINSDGYVVLSYYDNDGKLLYDLGPNGLDASSIKSSSLTSDTYVNAETFFGEAQFYLNTQYLAGKEIYALAQVGKAYAAKLFGSTMYSDGNEEIKKHPHNGYKPFSSYNKMQTLWLYHAAKENKTYVKDTARNIPTAALAEAADGKYFTSSTICDGTNIVNLASGTFFLKTAAVMNAPYPMATVDTGDFKYPAYCIVCVTFKDGEITSPSRIYSTVERTVTTNLVVTTDDDE